MINQETVIRLALVKNVHVLMNDVDSIKRNIASSDTTVSNLQQMIETLKTQVYTLQQENKKLADDNKELRKQTQEFQEHFTKVDENITVIYEHQQVTEIKNEEKRQALFNQTTHVLEDIKIEVRYLSVTLLDFKEKTEKDDKIEEENIQKIKSHLNSTLDYVNAIFWRTEGLLGNFSASIKDIEYSQSEISRTQMENFTNTVFMFEERTKKTEYEQLKLSSAVSSLEVFRINVSKSNCDKISKIAFSAGITSNNNGWTGDTLIFPDVIYNEGRGYNSNTGVFTANTGGTYVFYISIQSAYQKYNYFDIVLNGSSKVRALAWYNSGFAVKIHQTGTNLVILPLRSGDRVWVKRAAGTGYYSDSARITTFSGFRLF
ncbi:uncharacterized protein LOC133186087 [Saccostrea echinata]|uniref:uncharacterized protein LOC133186087 n=1 Tax=Saccostrea echinata TaxID=191078 RepID=UPI002A82839A|nr:uncharacterized protein LOC133186087 [Saccostrea echinata]